MATVQGGIERRRYHRYLLSLPVRVRSKAKAGELVETSTKDISAHGIYIFLPEELELGSELELDIKLPVEISGMKDVRVHCRSKIARLDRKLEEGRVGVGAVIEHYEFVQESKDQ